MKKAIIIDPDFEQRKKEGYYFMNFYCSNCGRPNGLYKGSVDMMIPRGENAKCILVCPNCENKTLSA